MKRKTRPILLALVLAGFGIWAVACSPVTVQDTLNRSISTRGLKVQYNIHYGPDVRNVMDIYAPKNAVNAPVVLFIHGGSWENGDKDGHKFVGDSLARAGYVTGVISYRLAPENRYPSYVQDAALALKKLQEMSPEFGGDPKNLFVMGHSAGGFNAVELVDNQRWLAEVKLAVTGIRGVVGIAGPYSYDFRQFSSAKAFPEGSNPDDIMPDRHVRPDAPPHLLLVAENDQTVYPQNAINMEAALKKAGIPVERKIINKVDHVTIMAAMARPLTFLGSTRPEVIKFIEAHRLP